MWWRRRRRRFRPRCDGVTATRSLTGRHGLLELLRLLLQLLSLLLELLELLRLLLQLLRLAAVPGRRGLARTGRGGS
jgi:hypothetical protein